MPISIIQLPGIDGTTGFQHDDDTSQGLETAQGWQAIQTAQQDATRDQKAVALVPVPDFGCCGLHYSHKVPVSLSLSVSLSFCLSVSLALSFSECECVCVCVSLSLSLLLGSRCRAGRERDTEARV